MTPLTHNFLNKMVKNIPMSLFETIIFLTIFRYLCSLAYQLCISAVLGGLGTNGWYEPIILTYMILSINLCPQDNHNPPDHFQGLLKSSLLKILTTNEDNFLKWDRFTKSHQLQIAVISIYCI